MECIGYIWRVADHLWANRYRGLWSASNLRDADAFLLVYDITNHDSLVALDYFNDLIQMDAEERPPEEVPQIKFVAGNKCDLAQSRQVSSAEGLSWARSHDCGYVTNTCHRYTYNVHYSCCENEMTNTDTWHILDLWRHLQEIWSTSRRHLRVSPLLLLCMSHTLDTLVQDIDWLKQLL